MVITNKIKKNSINAVLLICGLALIYEIIRDSLRPSDFDGYVRAGNAVLSGDYIYADHFNTWPPLFSIFSVLLAWGDTISFFAVRFLWNMGSLLAMLGTIQLTVAICSQTTFKMTRMRTVALLRNPFILLPLIIMLRYILDNMANVQINIYLLFCSVLTIYLFIHEKYAWAGLFLALTISLKVYTVFFLLYFIYKRAYRLVGFTFLFIIGLNLVSIGVFGYETAGDLYLHWSTNSTEQAYTAIHRNQSIFAMFFRFLTTKDPEQGMYVNFMELDATRVRTLVYGFVALIGIVPLFLFRKKLTKPDNLQSILEYSIIFTVVPLLTPVSWKAYFIFLWFPYFILFLVLFKYKPKISALRLKILRGLFFISVLFIVFSTELVVGNKFSDWLEAYSVITIGALILVIVQFMILITHSHFSLNSQHDVQ